MGRSFERTGLSSGSGRKNCLSKTNQHRHQVLQPRSALDNQDERTVPNGVLATCSRKWSSMTVPFIRKGTQRNSSWPGVSTLHTKAEYICADLSVHSSLFPCSQTADHTFWGSPRRRRRPSTDEKSTRFCAITPLSLPISRRIARYKVHRRQIANKPRKHWSFRITRVSLVSRRPKQLPEFPRDRSYTWSRKDSHVLRRPSSNITEGFQLKASYVPRTLSSYLKISVWL